MMLCSSRPAAGRLVVLIGFVALAQVTLGGTPASLNDVLEPIRAAHDVPALAAAVVRGEDVVAAGVAGMRYAGSDEKAELGDAFHIGSCTKAMTATVCAVLIDQGRLKWETTIGEVFPDLKDKVRAEYLPVTLEQLLSHRSGLPGDREPNPGFMYSLRALAGPMREQRRNLVQIALQLEPIGKPGATFEYSNAGYAIAGAMAEQVTDKTWEELVTELLFKPLGITSAGFGPPEHVYGHMFRDDRLIPMTPGPLADNPLVLGPAGLVHLTIEDWAKYAAFSLRAAQGKCKLLRPETARRLFADTYKQEYALGWGLGERPELGGQAYMHAGSNGMWFALIVLAPQRDAAVVVATNAGHEPAQEACREAAQKLTAEHVPQPTTAPR